MPVTKRMDADIVLTQQVGRIGTLQTTAILAQSASLSQVVGGRVFADLRLTQGRTNGVRNDIGTLAYQDVEDLPGLLGTMAVENVEIVEESAFDATSIAADDTTIRLVLETVTP